MESLAILALVVVGLLVLFALMIRWLALTYEDKGRQKAISEGLKDAAKREQRAREILAGDHPHIARLDDYVQRLQDAATGKG